MAPDLVSVLGWRMWMLVKMHCRSVFDIYGTMAVNHLLHHLLQSTCRCNHPAGGISRAIRMGPRKQVVRKSW